MESIPHKLDRLRSLAKDLEEIAEKRKTLLVKKLLAEAELQDAEDVSRASALGINMAISKIPLIIKNETIKERKKFFEANSNLKTVDQDYDRIIELLNAIKFDIKITYDLAHTTSL